MTPLITQDWSGFQYQFGVSARKRFLATGYANADAARAACPYQQGDELEMDARLRAAMPEVSTPNSPQNFVIDVQFSRITGSLDDENLLNQPPSYYPDLQDGTYPIDRDRYGAAITNSVGDAFSQNPNKEVTDIRYVYKQYESHVDANKLITFNDTVNDGALALPGFGSIAKGQGKLTIRVPQEFNALSKAILHTYVWKIRKEGWKTRILDKGRRGYVDGGGVGPFFFKGATPPTGVTDDVLLDGQGSPLIANRYVIGEKGDAARQAQPGSFQHVEVEAIVTGTFLRYEIYEEAPHGSLPLRT